MKIKLKYALPILVAIAFAVELWRIEVKKPLPISGTPDKSATGRPGDADGAPKNIVIRGNANDPEHHFPQSRQKFLAAFPPGIARDSGVIMKPSAPGIWVMELALRGKRVMATDVRILQNADGEWAMRDFVPPPLPQSAPDFPPIDVSALTNLIRAKLVAESAQIQSIQPLDPIWVPQTADLLLPCASFQVNYNASNGDLHREMWCVQPSTKQIFLRGSTIRN